MKKIVLLLLLFLSLYGYSQITYTDSVHHVSVSGYAGVLTYPAMNIQDKKISAHVTTRLGATVNWFPKSSISLFGLAAMEIDETAHVDPFVLVGLKLSPHKKILITVGKIATPMTELRPLPTTSAGQFESWTQSKILGSAYGGKITYTPNQKFTLVAGGFWRGNSEASVELGIKVRYTQFASYYMVQQKTFGTAIKIDYKLISLAINYNHRQNAGLFNSITFPKTHGLSLCSDIGFDTNTGKMIRGEWGLYEPVKSKWFNALFGLSYNYVTRSINTYVFVYL
jgi:hypothetical protein